MNVKAVALEREILHDFHLIWTFFSLWRKSLHAALAHFAPHNWRRN
jgi:hypothetical protein